MRDKREYAITRTDYNKWKTRVSKAILAARALQGDAWSGTQLAYESARDWMHKNFPGGMPPRRSSNRKKKGTVKKRSRRRQNRGFMGVSRIPVRRVVPYSATSGSNHRWYYQVHLSLFSKMFSTQYTEFKISHLRVRYLPNNATNETGLYSAVLLDREGFGSYGSATASSWFPTIGAMPGAKIRARYIPSVFTWRPTEPSAREWHTKDQDSVYCTIYICNNGKETDELGGMLEISGVMLARGLYWKAVVAATLESSQSDGAGPSHLLSEVSDLRLITPTSPRSRSSSIGGFHVLG